MLTQLFERPSRDGRSGLQLFGRSKTETNFFRKRVEVGKQKSRELHEFGRRFFREFFLLVEGVVSIEANAVGPRFQILGDLALRGKLVNALFELPGFDLGTMGFQRDFEAAPEHGGSRSVVAPNQATYALFVRSFGCRRDVLRSWGFLRDWKCFEDSVSIRINQHRWNCHRVVGVRRAKNPTGEWATASRACSKYVPNPLLREAGLRESENECGVCRTAMRAIGNDRSHVEVSCVVVGRARSRLDHLSACASTDRAGRAAE